MRRGDLRGLPPATDESRLAPADAFTPASERGAAIEPDRTPAASTRPAVAFVDDGGLTPFVQLATALRRAGYRTLRVTTAPTTMGAAVTRRFAFDRVWHVDEPGIDAIDALLADEELLDVHCVEKLAVAAYRALDRLPGADGAGWRNRADLIDKTNMLRLIHAAGIGHPDALPGTTDPTEAARQFGLPVVAKPRVGAYGRGVFVAPGVAELAAHLASVSPGDTQLEAFIEGESVSYCAIVGESVERDMTYRTLRRGSGPSSPSAEIECTTDDALRALGRRLAEALPCRGMVNVDAIRDHRGRYFVHDVNLRVYGALFAAWSTGFDLTAAYLSWLSDQVRRGTGDAGRALVFPDSALAAILADRRRPGLRTIARQLRQYRRLLGSAYALRELAGLTRVLVLGARATGDPVAGRPPARPRSE